MQRAPALAPAADPALGLQSGNPWPSEQDAVVERWLELTRAARARGADER